MNFVVRLLKMSKVYTPLMLSLAVLMIKLFGKETWLLSSYEVTVLD